jgi:hypothetical protein
LLSKGWLAAALYLPPMAAAFPTLLGQLASFFAEEIKRI